MSTCISVYTPTLSTLQGHYRLVLSQSGFDLCSLLQKFLSECHCSSNEFNKIVVRVHIQLVSAFILQIQVKHSVLKSRKEHSRLGLSWLAGAVSPGASRSLSRGMMRKWGHARVLYRPAIIQVSHESAWCDALWSVLVGSLWSIRQRNKWLKASTRCNLKWKTKRKSPRHCFRVREFSLPNNSSCSRGRSRNVFILI